MNIDLPNVINATLFRTSHSDEMIMNLTLEFNGVLYADVLFRRLEDFHWESMLNDSTRRMMGAVAATLRVDARCQRGSSDRNAKYALADIEEYLIFEGLDLADKQ